MKINIDEQKPTASGWGTRAWDETVNLFYRDGPTRDSRDNELDPTWNYYWNDYYNDSYDSPYQLED